MDPVLVGDTLPILIAPPAWVALELKTKRCDEYRLHFQLPSFDLREELRAHKIKQNRSRDLRVEAEASLRSKKSNMSAGPKKLVFQTSQRLLRVLT